MNRIVPALLLAFSFPVMAFAETWFAPPVSYFQNQDSEERYFRTAPPVSVYHQASMDYYGGTYGQGYNRGSTNDYNTFDYAPPERRPNYYPTAVGSSGYGSYDGYRSNTNDYNTFDYAPSYLRPNYYPASDYGDQAWYQGGGTNCVVTSTSTGDRYGTYRTTRTCYNGSANPTSRSQMYNTYDAGGSDYYYDQRCRSDPYSTYYDRRCPY